MPKTKKRVHPSFLFFGKKDLKGAVVKIPIVLQKTLSTVFKKNHFTYSGFFKISKKVNPICRNCSLILSLKCVKMNIVTQNGQNDEI